MTEGAVGDVPVWYRILRAARYLGVEPWALLEREAEWYLWALAAESAEIRAERARTERAGKGRRWRHK